MLIAVLQTLQRRGRMPGNNRDIDLSLVAAHQQAPAGGTEVRAEWHFVSVPWSLEVAVRSALE